MIRLNWLVGILTIGLLAGCGSSSHGTAGTGGTGGSGGSGGTAGTTSVSIQLGHGPGQADILFVIDRSASIAAEQKKLLSQIPTFFQALKASQPSQQMDLHVAVISADMGAPGDGGLCTPSGDAGLFLTQPTGTCTDTTLASGASFLSTDGTTANFTAPIDQTVQCLSALGTAGCGFNQHLAAIDHALGSDNLVNGVPTPPAGNAGFLRPDAALAVIILTNQDDCSAPRTTDLFSLGGQPSNLANPLGPLQRYRCNRYGHLCTDPSGQNNVMPPLAMSAGTTSVALTNCMSNEAAPARITPVKDVVTHLRALKADPDHQIVVGGILGPTSPYEVGWAQDATTSEQWPVMLHSCGASGGDGVSPHATMHTTDGSLGDPSVRLTQFVDAFPVSVLASNCDFTYAASMTAIANKTAQAMNRTPCVMGPLQKTADGQPMCTVTEQYTNGSGAKVNAPVPNCNENGGTPPCYTLQFDASHCPSDGGLSVRFAADPSTGAPADATLNLTCSVCDPAKLYANGCT